MIFPLVVLLRAFSAAACQSLSSPQVPFRAARAACSPKPRTRRGSEHPCFRPPNHPRLRITLTLHAMGRASPVVCRLPPRIPRRQTPSALVERGKTPGLPRNLYNNVLSGPAKDATLVVVVVSCSSVASKPACSAFGISHRPRHRVRAFFFLFVSCLGAASTSTVPSSVLCAGEA